MVSSGTMQYFLYPISPARRRKAIRALAAGECISVGSCNIRPEETTGILWGAIETGEDVRLSNENNAYCAAQAVDWAISIQQLTQPSHLSA